MYDKVGELRSINILPVQEDGLSPQIQRLDHKIRANTDSECTTSLAQQWLSNCQANHPECNRNVNVHNVLPLRVIDVGKIGDPSVCLSVSDLSHPYGKYITLSHCWGDSDVLKLTTDNEMALRTGFAIKDLLKTFREAIQFTRALSVQYLWIDSLCILQDSLEDWKHQSALMGEIYKNCFCNLAATSSSNSQGGIFVERDLNMIRPFNLAIMEKSLDGGITHQGRYYVYDAGLWGSHVETAPLNRRGWVLQERILAPRVVHFSNYISWECKSLAASEITPTGGREFYRRDHNDFYRFLKLIESASAQKHQATDQKTGISNAAHNMWLDLVKKYSNCALSKEEDILVAISGIANIMESTWKDQYIGGLWRSTLLKDLLWSTKGEPRLLRIPLPTWSWASRKGPISWDQISWILFDHVDLAELLDFRIKTFGDEPNGQIEVGYLTFQSFLFYLVWTGNMYEQNISHYSSQITISWDPSFVRECDRKKKGAKALCMPIMIGDSGGDVLLSGLLLEPSPPGYLESYPEGSFVRVGVFSLTLPGYIDPLAYLTCRDIMLELE
ncbi:HET-domain-containing protein [Hyaloscypha variabilis F]|uniref:HET-domain-containing protein n=1 Tax=Hyaloscypha variabilis (strain UAMH 11265 / GT02V1 / F) TaxID=1149755 RepID=A0A2J6RUP4_HYAVF|nr:HET-domain-containing protein [Hyaloscypha variabilis F]